MLPKIWLEMMPLPDVAAKLEGRTELLVGPSHALDGIFAAVIGNVIDANGTWMDGLGPELRVVARPGIGVDNIDLAAATERGILVVNTPDAPTESTAEHAVALLMSLAARTALGNQKLSEGAWDRSGLFGMELMGRTIGVVGFGRIGRRVAEICGRGLRMNVLVFDPFARKAIEATDYTEPVDSLDELLRQSHVLTLHCPLLPETHHLLNAERLALLPDGAYVINCARGPVIDEAALFDALQSGRLAGAGLDVFDPEPPRIDSLLLRLENVVVTPHIASYTDLGVAKMQHGVADQLLAILDGERPENLVNGAVWEQRRR